MSAKKWRQVRQRFNDESLEQACQRSGFLPPSLAPPQGLAIFYQSYLDEEARNLKIITGVHANGQVIGSSHEQLFGEIDFVHSEIEAVKANFRTVWGGS